MLMAAPALARSEEGQKGGGFLIVCLMTHIEVEF